MTCCTHSMPRTFKKSVTTPTKQLSCRPAEWSDVLERCVILTLELDVQHRLDQILSLLLAAVVIVGKFSPHFPHGQYQNHASTFFTCQSFAVVLHHRDVASTFLPCMVSRQGNLSCAACLFPVCTNGEAQIALAAPAFLFRQLPGPTETSSRSANCDAQQNLTGDASGRQGSLAFSFDLRRRSRWMRRKEPCATTNLVCTTVYVRLMELRRRVCCDCCCPHKRAGYSFHFCISIPITSISQLPSPIKPYHTIFTNRIVTNTTSKYEHHHPKHRDRLRHNCSPQEQGLPPAHRWEPCSALHQHCHRYEHRRLLHCQLRPQYASRLLGVCRTLSSNHPVQPRALLTFVARAPSTPSSLLPLSPSPSSSRTRATSLPSTLPSRTSGSQPSSSRLKIMSTARANSSRPCRSESAR